uniref:Uncharacterized protein LOC114342219 n=1 Tax=Diabrotica virgifera virgifera TaxID=50390 RepID=A0A6P7GYF6_DIAVI
MSVFPIKLCCEAKQEQQSEIDMDRWVGKVAVVTGASSGIGAGIAKALVEKGVLVVGIARRIEKIEDLSRSLTDQSGKLFALRCDVAKEDDILRAFRWIADNVGHIHILVNNAGLTRPTNLVGKNKLIQRYKKVCMVCVGDPAITITSISPGLVRTEFTEGFPQDGTKEKLDDMPDLRPDDIAEGVIYALSTGPHVNQHTAHFTSILMVVVQHATDDCADHRQLHDQQSSAKMNSRH